MLRALCSVLLTLSLGSPAFAQIGHDPARSPYRDIPKGGALLFSSGWFSGDRGVAGVSPTDGNTFTGRYEVQLGGPFLFGAGASWLKLDRYVVNPLLGAANRRTGPHETDILNLDASITARLTGAKTWRHLSPYGSVALGVAFELNGPPDPSDYEFGTKFTFAPGLGVRVHPGRHLFLAADFRWLFWKLTYPIQYSLPSPVDTTTVIPFGSPESDWTTHTWGTVGIGWIF